MQTAHIKQSEPCHGPLVTLLDHGDPSKITSCKRTEEDGAARQHGLHIGEKSGDAVRPATGGVPRRNVDSHTLLVSTPAVTSYS
jgi:hypothetical protein